MKEEKKNKSAVSVLNPLDFKGLFRVTTCSHHVPVGQSEVTATTLPPENAITGVINPRNTGRGAFSQSTKVDGLLRGDNS